MKGEKAVKGFEKLPDFLLFTLPVRDVKSPFGIFLGINFDSENFSSFAKFAFQNKRPLLKKQNGARSLQGKNLLRFFAGILFGEGIVFRKYQSLF